MSFVGYASANRLSLLEGRKSLAPPQSALVLRCSKQKPLINGIQHAFQFLESEHRQVVPATDGQHRCHRQGCADSRNIQTRHNSIFSW